MYFYVLRLEWFSDVTIKEKETIKGIVVPHAGWVYAFYLFSFFRYSGRIAAESFAHLQNQSVERVFVLGPCHRYYSQWEFLFQSRVESACLLKLPKWKLLWEILMLIRRRSQS